MFRVAHDIFDYVLCERCSSTTVKQEQHAIQICNKCLREEGRCIVCHRKRDFLDEDFVCVDCSH